MTSTHSLQSKSISAHIETLNHYSGALQRAHGRPQNFKFVGNTLFWLQGTPLQLYCYNRDTDSAPHLVVDEALPAAQDQKLSKEEELIRERTRSRVTGVQFYRVRPSDSTVLFSTNGQFYCYYFGSTKYPNKGPYPILLKEKMEECFPSLPDGPCLFFSFGKTVNAVSADGHVITVRFTFVRDYNLFEAVITEIIGNDGTPPSSANIQIRDVKQLTSWGSALRPVGVADYIIQEEFDRLIGHCSSGDDRYLAYTYTDCSRTRMVALPSGKTPLRDNVLPSAERTSHMNYLAEEDGGLERMAYPRVGDANVLPLLLLYDRTTGEHRYIPPAALRAVAPWYEYLCRFGFKDGKTLYLSLLSRTQEQYVVVSCAFAGLPTLGDRSPQTILDEDKDTHGVSFTVEWAQTIPWAWVEIPSGRPIHFGKYNDFLVCHDTFEEGGRAYFHLFYRPAGGDKDSWAPLTQGDWNVTPTSLSVEEQEGTGITVVYFEANAHDRLVKQLYRVQLDSTAKHPCVFSASTITPISPEREHVYCYCNTTKGVYYLSSTAVTPPQLHFYTEADRAVVPLDDWMLPDGKTPTSQHSPHTGLPPGTPLVIPSSVTVHNKKGVPLSANVFIPTSYQEHDKSQKLPLVLYVYGGPHVQLVHQHEYYAPYNAILQSALQGGIAAAVVDNSMSNANGLRDLSVCKNNMGHFETDDYVTVVKYLTSNPVLQHANVELRVDPERIAIFGWSYGGYSTLLAMSQAASVFKLGLAGAPVGDWRLYDTGYTERYLGLLTEEEETGVTEESVTVPVRAAYLQSAIAAHVKGFPEELNRLYIAHGLLDENVHFVNTCSVIEALIQEGKPFNMIVYPGERHGLRQKKESRLHHDGHLLKVLHDLL